MYESRHQPPLPRRHFVRRLVFHAILSGGLIGASLFVGMLGYVLLERLSWIEAFLNAAMLLGGMGPIDPPLTVGGKLFAGLYALYAGLVILIAASVLFAPAFHRLMHHFHWNDPGSS